MYCLDEESEDFIRSQRKDASKDSLRISIGKKVSSAAHSNEKITFEIPRTDDTDSGRKTSLDITGNFLYNENIVQN